MITVASSAGIASDTRLPELVNDRDQGKPGLLLMVGTFGLCLVVGLVEAARIAWRMR